MPDFPSGLTGGPTQTGANASASKGVAVTTGTGGKGAWTQVVAATAHPTTWLLVHLHPNAQFRYLVDIGIGAAGSEQVLAPDLYAEGVFASSQLSSRCYLFPISVPVGTRLSARAAGSGDGYVISVALTAVSPAVGSSSGLGRVEAYGVDVAAVQGVVIDPGATANQDGLWTELTPATGMPVRWIMLAVGRPNAQTVSATTTWLLDLAIGGAAAELEVIPDLPCTATTQLDFALPGVITLPVSLPQGSRLSARARCSDAASPNRLIGLIAYGVG